MDMQIGCQHYKRKCIFLTPCCKKKYACRQCHDSAEDHPLNRKAIEKVQCTLCTAIQPISDRCRSCRIMFGRYACLKCNMFDFNEKGQFHCDACGICRIGGRGNFFHCEKCNLCLNISLTNTHKCVENASHTGCPVCLEDIHSSVHDVVVPQCGHLIHKKCMEDLQKANIFKCSICADPLKSIL